MIPVIAALVGDGAVVSVDTMRAEVAEAAIAAGASVVNDVSGGLADPRILDVVAGSGATYVAMHWRAHSDRMQDLAVYDEPGGVVAAVRRELGERVDAMRPPGSRRTGSSSTRAWASPSGPSTTGRCCAGSRTCTALGYPLLVGASRKSFLGTLLAGPDGTPRPVAEREEAGHALTAAAGPAGRLGGPGARRPRHS